MFEIVEEFIYQRLRRIAHNDRPITVYRYEPHRDKGKPEYPCIAFERSRYDIDYSRARPDGIIFEPSEELDIIRVNPLQTGSGEFEERQGPSYYRIKPYPVAINIFYYLNVLATQKDHADYLQLMLAQAFPPGYMPNIAGQSPLMSLSRIESSDDLSVPLFEVDCVLAVEGVWIERIVPGRTVPSIKTPVLAMEVTESHEK